MAENKEIIKIIGTVESIPYYKNEWGIIVLSLDKIKQGKPRTDGFNQVTVKGNMPEPKRGDMYNITAEYVIDPKWGGQYNILSIFSAITFDENDVVGQKRFLLSLFTPLQVENMYKALDNPFAALQSGNILELVKVKGCGMTTAISWMKKFKNKMNIALVYMELEKYNLTHNMIKRLLGRYNDSPDLVVEKVKSNPYVLCNEVNGIGWKTADKIALDGGIEPYSTIRIGEYIKHYLNICGDNGCSWITCDELMGAIIEQLGEEVPDTNITEAIHEIEDSLWWNEEKSKIGLKKYYMIEQRVAEELIRLRDAESNIKYSNWEEVISHLEFQQGWEYTEEQKLGIKLGLDNNVVVITGSGGTGKTSLVSAILAILHNYSFAQCALSGRAGSRMQEITGKEGFTIHRLLGWPSATEFAKNGFEYHDENPLNYDIYIVDEISMIDSFLFYNLLRAIPNGAKLFLLGDPGQLESLGSGNIAHDMISSPEIKTVTLTQIHRQAAKSAIITESNKVRKGQQLIAKDWVGTEIRGELQDLNLNCYSDSSNTFYEIIKTFSYDLNDPHFNIMDTQIIVPLKNRGMACTYEINNAIQEIYNPHKDDEKEITSYNNQKLYILRKGDKVINVKNNYQTDPPIYNGNIGIIRFIGMDENLDEEVMIIDFYGIGTVTLLRDCWNDIELAYAITVHKSQGSEFDHVIFGLDFQSYSLLNREIVYTGITRAKKKCSLITQSGALRMAISKENVSKKQTHLQQCLYEVSHPKLIF